MINCSIKCFMITMAKSPAGLHISSKYAILQYGVLDTMCYCIENGVQNEDGGTCNLELMPAKAGKRYINER